MGKYKPELPQLNRLWRRMLYSKIVNIFTFENLPEEINEQAMKLGLFTLGKLVFYKIGDKYLVQKFTYTDLLDWYYIPVHGRVVNPWLPQGHQNWEFTVADECCIYCSTPDMYSYRERGIVSDLVYKTATQLSENDISYYCIQRNHRLIAIITAQDDKQRAEAEVILRHMYDGDPEMVMKDDLVNHINVNPIALNATRSPLTELIEFQQYILGNYLHNFGINSNYNLKREQLNSNEIDVNKEVLRLNIEDMLQNWTRGFEKANEKYNLDIRVLLNEKVYASLLQEEQILTKGINPEAPDKENGTAGQGMGTSDEQVAENGSEERNSNVPDNKLDTESEDSSANIRSDTETDEETKQSDEDENKTPEADNGQVVLNININTPEVSNLSLETSEKSSESDKSDSEQSDENSEQSDEEKRDE
jgi:hypothetical protein